MFANFSDIIKIPVALLLGMTLSALVLILLYEGVSLPLFGQVINGRVANAVDSATADLVTKADLTATKAQLARERELRRAADIAATEAKKRAAAALRLKAQAQKELEDRILADDTPEGATWSKEDLEWLGR